MKQLIDAGVHGIITDYPQTLRLLLDDKPASVIWGLGSADTAPSTRKVPMEMSVTVGGKQKPESLRGAI